MTDRDWKLKLRYGRLTTPFTHYTVIANGVIEEPEKWEPGNPVGPAYMAMKVWAASEDEATDMICAIGKDVGFVVSGDLRIYLTDPIEPPREAPFGYDIRFTPYG